MSNAMAPSLLLPTTTRTVDDDDDNYDDHDDDDDNDDNDDDDHQEAPAFPFTMKRMKRIPPRGRKKERGQFQQQYLLAYASITLHLIPSLR